MMTYLHVELLQFLLLARSSRRSFCERRNPFNKYRSTELNWRDPVRELREFVVIFEILPIDNEWKSNEIILRIADLRRFVALTTGILRFKLTFSHIDNTWTRTLQLCFALPNKIRIQFRFHSNSVVDYVKYC